MTRGNFKSQDMLPLLGGGLGLLNDHFCQAIYQASVMENSHPILISASSGKDGLNYDVAGL